MAEALPVLLLSVFEVSPLLCACRAAIRVCIKAASACAGSCVAAVEDDVGEVDELLSVDELELLLAPI